MLPVTKTREQSDLNDLLMSHSERIAARALRKHSSGK
jgi:hypothetical protein